MGKQTDKHKGNRMDKEAQKKSNRRINTKGIEWIGKHKRIGWMGKHKGNRMDG